MARNDSALITGLSSASSRRIAEQQQRNTRESAEKGSKLRPHGKILADEITKIRAEIAAEIGNIIHLEMSPEDVKTTVLGLRLADQKIVSLQSRLLKSLRAEAKS